MADFRRGERGGIAVLLAIVMVALLGFTAFAVDVGMVYSERAQLQNGADSAAMGVAQTCAKRGPAAQCSESEIEPLAMSLANPNALDNLVNLEPTPAIPSPIALDTANRTVTVTPGAQEVGKEANKVTTFFAGALGIPSMQVQAKATVQWGSPIKGTAPFPMAISVCQVETMVDGGVQLLQSHGANKNPDCIDTQSGSTVPGGFAWLTSDPGICGALVDLEVDEGASDPGNNAPPGCADRLNGWATDMNAGKQVVVFLPVYTSVTGTGSGATYNVNSFAALEVHGWKFSGNSTLPDTFQNRNPPQTTANECRGDCRGIIGKFITYTSLADGFELGDVSDHGATIVQYVP